MNKENTENEKKPLTAGPDKKEKGKKTKKKKPTKGLKNTSQDLNFNLIKNWKTQKR